MYIDIHTHHLSSISDCLQVQNLSRNQLLEGKPIEGLFSAGIHPWWVKEETSSEGSNESCLINKALQSLSASAQMIFIGEVGLDKASGDWSEQYRIFDTQLVLASKTRKPVLIHCVRAMQEILALKKQYSSIPTWIIHGFRGSPEQAVQWIGKGCYLSFGEKFNPAALKVCPLDKLFLETDMSSMGIDTIYQRTATVLSMPVAQLEQQIQINFEKLQRDSQSQQGR